MFIRMSRPSRAGDSLCHISGHSATRYQFEVVFSKVIHSLGWDCQSYKTHSFCFGASTSAWDSGSSEHDIAYRGRWKSHCVRYFGN